MASLPVTRFSETGAWSRGLIASRWPAIFGLLILVGLLDHWAGFEISVLPLYFLPLAWAAARWGLVGGLWLVLPATLVWLLADYGHPYEHDWYRIVNALGRALAFASAVVATRFLLERPGHPRVAADGGEAVMNSAVDVCTSCHSVRPAGGDWEDPVAYLREEAACELHAKLCPTCAHRAWVDSRKRGGA